MPRMSRGRVMYNQHRANVRNFLVGLTIPEIQTVWREAIARTGAGLNSRASYIEEYLNEVIREFNDCNRRIRTTYQVITPESAKIGDYAKIGWENEDGDCIKIDGFDVSWFGDEHAAVVAFAVDYLLTHGSGLVASTYPTCCPGNTWYTEADGDKNYSDGSEKTLAFHLVGFTADEENAIYKIMAA